MTAPTLQRRLDEVRQMLLTQDFAQALSRYDKLTPRFPRQAVLRSE